MRSRRNRRLAFLIDEQSILIREEVRGACEMLGLDPLYVANEGKLLARLWTQKWRMSCWMQREGIPWAATREGSERYEATMRGWVTMRTLLGTTRIVDMLARRSIAAHLLTDWLCTRWGNSYFDFGCRAK